MNMKDYIKEDNLRMNRIKDIIDLIMSMQALRYGVSLAEIQEKYEVSRRTATRMKDIVLELCPQAVELQTNSRVKRWGFKGKAVNLYNYTPDDIVDIENIKELCKINNLEIKTDVLDKLINSIKSSTNTNLSAYDNDIEALLECEGFAARQGSNYKIDGELLSKIRVALKSMKKVRFDYNSADYEIDKKTGFRRIKGLKPTKTVIVEPLGIIYNERHYLVAKDRDKIKNYMIHKISNFEILEEYVSPDNAFDLKKYTQESFGVFHDELVKVKLKFNKEVAEDVLNYNFHPTQKITQQKNGSIIVEFTSSGTKSILFNLFKWGSNVEIVSPKKLKDRYRNYLNEVLENLK